MQGTVVQRFIDNNLGLSGENKFNFTMANEFCRIYALGSCSPSSSPKKKKKKKKGKEKTQTPHFIQIKQFPNLGSSMPVPALKSKFS